MANTNKRKRFRNPGDRRNLPGYTSVLVWGVPEDLKKKFKAACSSRGQSMRDVVMGAMSDICKDEGLL